MKAGRPKNLTRPDNLTMVRIGIDPTMKDVFDHERGKIPLTTFITNLLYRYSEAIAIEIEKEQRGMNNESSICTDM